MAKNTKNQKKNNRGHSARWHEGVVETPDGKVNNCPCGGREQAVSPRLAARQAAFDPGNQAAGLLRHKPGSQNRKK